MLNQAAHALNTIALKIRHGAKLETEMLSLMKKATKSIDAVRGGFDDLKLDSEAIVESRKLYLDTYRQKPKKWRRSIRRGINHQSLESWSMRKGALLRRGLLYFYEKIYETGSRDIWSGEVSGNRAARVYSKQKRLGETWNISRHH